MLAEYLLNLSPSLLYLMAPVAVLLAVLITFGLLEKSSELTAMKATGISIYRAALPVIVVCAIFAAAMFVFDQLYIPHTNKEQEILRNQIKGNRRKPICRPTASGFSDRTTTSTTTRSSIPTPTSSAESRSSSLIRIPSSSPGASMPPMRIGKTSLNKWVFEQGWMRHLSGTSIQDYRTFDVATFNELHEDPELLQEGSEAVVGDELRRA